MTINATSGALQCAQDKKIVMIAVGFSATDNLAQGLSAQGARVSLVTDAAHASTSNALCRSDNGEGARREAERLCETGARAAAVALDLGEEASIRAMIDFTLSTFGGLDVLFNNAAATHLSRFKDSAVEQMDTQVWDDTLRINLRGCMLANRMAIEPMRQRRAGSIINTSSAAAQAGALGYSAYAVSKGRDRSLDPLYRDPARQRGNSRQCHFTRPDRAPRDRAGLRRPRWTNDA